MKTEMNRVKKFREYLIEENYSVLGMIKTYAIVGGVFTLIGYIFKFILSF